MLLNLKELHKKYDMKVKGVIHIGAHFGEENSVYDELGYSNRIFFEPLPQTIEVLKNNIKTWPIITKALGACPGIKTMYVEEANKGQSSSLLKPKLHLQQYPHISFFGRQIVEVDTLDNCIKEKTQFNFINIDVQGYELEVFKGSKNILPYIDYIMSEVNRAEVYENCCRVEEIDSFLKDYGFCRVETTWDGTTWGDAFFIKK